MNLIKANTLKPGMVFSQPVFTEDNNMLVPALVPLRQKDIDLLVNWKIDEVTTSGEIISDVKNVPVDLKKMDHNEIIPEINIQSEIEAEIALEKPKKAVKFILSDVRQNSGPYRVYKSLIDKLDGIFSALSSGQDIQMRPIDNLCTQLLQEVRDNKDSFIDYILGGEISGHELAKSSVNTAILSALIAQELRLPNHKTLHIVAASLLHDIGMLRLSRGITEKKGGLSDAELEQIKSHTTYTSKIITKELFGPREVNTIASQHHERWDGNGYPDHLAGQAIDIGARIISTADAFEAMVSKKSYRDSMHGYEAIKNLLSDNSRRFDPTVIMAFTRIMGIYPIGSIVKLNDSSIARVVKVQSGAPIRPTIQMLIDKTGKMLNSTETYDIDLLSEKTLYIKNALDPSEITRPNA